MYYTLLWLVLSHHANVLGNDFDRLLVMSQAVPGQFGRDGEHTGS
jgi:hypothetical protein